MNILLFSLLPYINSFKYPINKPYKKIIPGTIPGTYKQIYINIPNNTIIKNNIRDTKLYFKRGENDNEEDNDNIEKLGRNRGKNRGKNRDKNEKKDDILIKFSEFMGFSSKEKWKAVRYTIYALAIGYCTGDLIDKIGQDFSNPFRDI